MPPRSPTVRRRRLGTELKALREAKSLTAEQVASDLDWSPSKISRIETAQVRVTTVDLRAILDVFGVAGADREGLLELAKESRETGYWMRFKDETPVSRFKAFVGLEAEARRIRSYEPHVFPGLLQTEKYARAVHEVMNPRDPQIAERVALRMERQKVLLREPDPVNLEAIIDEAALRRPMGGIARNEVMGEQVRRLIEASSLPHVSLQVVPFDAGSHPSLGMNYAILDFPHPADPNVVYVETLTTALILEDVDEVARFRDSFDRTRAEAYGFDRSREFLIQIESEYPALSAELSV